MKRRRPSATDRLPTPASSPGSGAALLAAVGLAQIQASDVAAWEALIHQLKAEIAISEAIIHQLEAEISLSDVA